MNELHFFIHLIIIFGFGVVALKLGKQYLATWVAIQTILANLFVIKQMYFFGFNVTCSDAFAIGSILGLNLLQEYFGREIAKKALWGAFFSMIFFAAMSEMHLLYLPNIHDTAHAAYEQLLTPSPRLLAASITVFWFTQQMDMRLFQFLRQKKSMPFWARNAISLSLTQFFDTVLFTFLGLWGLVSSLWDIITVSFLLKILIISCMTPFLAFTKRFFHHHPEKGQ